VDLLPPYGGELHPGAPDAGRSDTILATNGRTREKCALVMG